MISMLVYIFELDSAIDPTDRSSDDLSELYHEVLKGNAVVVSDNQITDSDLLYNLYLEESRAISERKVGAVKKSIRKVLRRNDESVFTDDDLASKKMTPLKAFMMLIEKGVIYYGEHENTHSPSQYIQDKLDPESKGMDFGLWYDNLSVSSDIDNIPTITVYVPNRDVYLYASASYVPDSRENQSKGTFKINIGNSLLLKVNDTVDITLRMGSNERTASLRFDETTDNNGEKRYHLNGNVEGRQVSFQAKQYSEDDPKLFYFGSSAMGFLNQSNYEKDDDRRRYGLSACYKLRNDLNLSLRYHDADRIRRNWGKANPAVPEEFIEAIFGSVDRMVKVRALMMYVEMLLKFSVKDGRVGQIMNIETNKSSLMKFNESLYKYIQLPGECCAIDPYPIQAIVMIHEISNRNKGMGWDYRSTWYNDFKKENGSVIRNYLSSLPPDGRSMDEKWIQIKRALDLYNNYSIEYNTAGTALKYDIMAPESLAVDFNRRFGDRKHISVIECLNRIRDDKELRDNKILDEMAKFANDYAKVEKVDLDDPDQWLRSRQSLDGMAVESGQTMGSERDATWRKIKKIVCSIKNHTMAGDDDDAVAGDVKDILNDEDRKVDWNFFGRIMFNNNGAQSIRDTTDEWIRGIRNANDVASQHMVYNDEIRESSKAWSKTMGIYLSSKRMIPILFLVSVLGAILVVRLCNGFFNDLELAPSIVMYSFISVVITYLPDAIESALEAATDKIFKFNGTMDGLGSVITITRDKATLKKMINDSNGERSGLWTRIWCRKKCITE